MSAADSSVTEPGDASLADANGTAVAMPRLTVSRGAHSRRRRNMQSRMIVMFFLLALMVVPAIGYGRIAL